MRPLTPNTIVLAALPLLYLVMPSGIPLVNATSCTLGGDSAYDASIACNSCSDGGTGKVFPSNCSIVPSTSACEITVTATVENTIAGCDPEWEGICANEQCFSRVSAGAIGSVSAANVSRTLGCWEDGVTMRIRLHPHPTNCNNCTMGAGANFLIDAAAICNGL